MAVVAARVTAAGPLIPVPGRREDLNRYRKEVERRAKEASKEAAAKDAPAAPAPGADSGNTGGIAAPAEKPRRAVKK